MRVERKRGVHARTSRARDYREKMFENHQGVPLQRRPNWSPLVPIVSPSPTLHSRFWGSVAEVRPCEQSRTVCTEKNWGPR